ncbi:hypothetical protein CISG_08280 [Coccidioides immitis RMSCC 3703]|uniref:Uncharacterized protein n=1 Tax=Coccidioides immitis RMSCC 3703 TaxID=454286 RepID=A0A0J8U1B9_COCIT|nr:hypothetical protein CISG_08280 [Coccidioides immitis RMSCC 3703]
MDVCSASPSQSNPPPLAPMTFSPAQLMILCTVGLPSRRIPPSIDAPNPLMGPNYVIFNDNFCARAQKRAGIYNQYGFQAVPISQGESLRSMPEKKIPVHPWICPASHVFYAGFRVPIVTTRRTRPQRDLRCTETTTARRSGGLPRQLLLSSESLKRKYEDSSLDQPPARDIMSIPSVTTASQPPVTIGTTRIPSTASNNGWRIHE